MALSDAATSIEAMEREFNRLQREIRIEIQDRLAKFSGRSLSDLQSNRQLVTAIHQLLDSHGLRVRCNECGHPAILRVSPRRGAPSGVFVFDHTIDGRRTFHGGRCAIPTIVLIGKPPRKTIQSKPEKRSGPAKQSSRFAG
jgi:hypothetical protein